MDLLLKVDFLDHISYVTDAINTLRMDLVEQTTEKKLKRFLYS